MSKVWAALDCNNVMQQRWRLLDLLLAVTGSGGWVKGTKAQPADGAGGTCAHCVGRLPPGNSFLHTPQSQQYTPDPYE